VQMEDQTPQMKKLLRRVTTIGVVAALIVCAPPCRAYSVLTHEAIIDVLWDTNIRSLLLKRFPDATPDELLKAHAYVYGGAIIQDIGYYPHGNKFFSDLAHYFRSGDFIVSLLRNSQTLNEYAFAIGALAHYAADNDGHRLATNVAVPMLYPELKKKYGPAVTYEDNPMAHIKTEFAFDVLQVAKGHYAPDSYHNFVGFEVSLPVVERAFKETYGIELKSVISNEQQAANSYRSSVNGLIPKATRVAWNLKQNEIQKDEPGITRKKFLYNLSRASYEKEWGKDYQRPTASDKFLAFAIRILPKIGPLRILTFRTPTPEAQKLFENSFNLTVDRYRSLLNQLGQGELQLPNDNFDVGEVTARGQYKLGDKTCAELLDRLARQRMAGVDQELKTQLLAFYATKDNSSTMKRHEKSAARLQQEIKELQDSPAVSTSAGE
jgi:Zinc dependent phospholipase C